MFKKCYKVTSTIYTKIKDTHRDRNEESKLWKLVRLNLKMLSSLMIEGKANPRIINRLNSSSKEINFTGFSEKNYRNKFV